ncbi:hypothetical protein [Marinomonas algicola]|uniref:hypothetical protein n=1 Tax=Marinomonas algicola TaxID=2773454 RepID=UPI00174BD09E|nr:hypothetical protein [Marinomonas algicola]
MSLWDEAGDFFGKVGGVFVDYVEAKETDQPQIPASVGVTEPVASAPQTPTQQTVTVTPSSQLISGISNQALALIGGGGLLLVVLLTRGR